jgi:hypothetical protein
LDQRLFDPLACKEEKNSSKSIADSTFDTTYKSRKVTAELSSHPDLEAGADALEWSCSVTIRTIPAQHTAAPTHHKAVTSSPNNKAPNRAETAKFVPVFRVDATAVGPNDRDLRKNRHIKAVQTALAAKKDILAHATISMSPVTLSFPTTPERAPKRPASIANGRNL